jgi:hypothetical protein
MKTGDKMMVVKMKNYKRHTIERCLFLVLIIAAFNFSVFSRIYHNGSGAGYNQNNVKSTVNFSSILENYIIEGAICFFEGKSNIQLLLQRVELQDFQGLNFDELLQLTNRALTNINAASRTYQRLVRLAKRTPYRRGIITRLKSFDYDAFATEHRLNKAIFAGVRSFLEIGDITGTFIQTRSSLETMASLLKEIKRNFLANRMPGLSLFWRLNETAASTGLFGSYVARVFHTLR